MDIQHILEVAWQNTLLYTPKIVFAIVTLVIGLWVIKGLDKVLLKALDKKDVDKSLKGFLKSIFDAILKILLVLSVISMVGIATTSFVAILAAAGFAIGMALQGSLANFAGGVMLLILKPIKVGEYIEAQGHAGSVEEVQIFYTVLKTPDNSVITLPNGQLANNAIKNYTREDKRRIDFTFGIGYSDDIPKARQVLKRIVDADDRIITDPEPMIVIEGLGDSSVNFKVRVWVKTSDYWSLYFDMLEKVKMDFDKEGINIPFPQRDVHLYNHG